MIARLASHCMPHLQSHNQDIGLNLLPVVQHVSVFSSKIRVECDCVLKFKKITYKILRVIRCLLEHNVCKTKACLPVPNCALGYLRYPLQPH